MKRSNPKFLKAMPEFYGLGFQDLIVLMIALYFSVLFNITPILSLVFSGLGILIMKVLRKYFDFKGWIMPRRKKILISEIKRGHE